MFVQGENGVFSVGLVPRCHLEPGYKASLVCVCVCVCVRVCVCDKRTDGEMWERFISFFYTPEDQQVQN